jgi:hypothetical protein
MLAEIFFLRLEADIRAAEETSDKARFFLPIPRAHNIDIVPNTKPCSRLVVQEAG